MVKPCPQTGLSVVGNPTLTTAEFGQMYALLKIFARIHFKLKILSKQVKFQLGFLLVNFLTFFS